MIPVFSVVAHSGTGKTTLLEKLIAELKGRGVRLAVIKHDAHHFQMDREGKDTWRFARAGADITAIASSEMSAFLVSRELPIEEMLTRITGVDLILTEGYKTARLDKIAVYRAASGNQLPGAPEDFAAIVTDTPFEAAVPQFGLEDAARVADFIEARIRAQGGA